MIAVLLLGGGDDPSASGSSAAQSAQTEDTAEELRRRFAAREKQQIEELTSRARTMVEDFTPVVAGLAKTLPPDTDEVGPLASAEGVDDWLGRVREADEFFEETVSGETATNVARNGLGNAVDVLLETVETYKLALREPSARAALLESARRQRDLAARAWFTAATQLDVVNIDAGFGHQHVTFPRDGGKGAVPPDSIAQGTDAEAPEDR